MSLRILVAEPQDFSRKALEILESIGEVTCRTTEDESLNAAFQDFDVIWFRLAHRIGAQQLGKQPRCRILATPVTGLDHIDLAACEERDVRVVSLKGEIEFLKRIRATAELTVGLALALLRQIPAASQAVLRGEWNRDLFRGRELYEKTAGIVGLGRLGAIVAGYLRAFGMRVLAYDPRPDFPLEAAERVTSLPELLGESDLVSIHVNYSPMTHHLIGVKEFAVIKPSSVLINTSRGGVIDEQALIAALESGQIAGAALDVLKGEPSIDAAHPLVAYAQRQPRLLIVPHIGGNTRESFEKTEVFLAGRVVDVAREKNLKIGGSTGSMLDRTVLRASS